MRVRSAFRYTSSYRFASSLVVASHGKGLDAGTLNAVSCAQKIGGDVTVLVAGHNVGDIANEASAIGNVSKVLVADHESLDHGVAESNAELIAKLVEKHNFTHVLAPSDARGKNYLPRAAALLDVGAMSDVTGVEGEDTFHRPIYAGNANSTVKSTDKVKLLTVRLTAFEPAELGGSAAVETEDFAPEGRKATWVSEEIVKSERPALVGADVVVSGGRGLKNGENFQLLYDLAEKLNAAVGASRAAVDAGYVPNDMQVGQTGKVVAPQLYIAVGLSGAIQHLAGMKDSKVIVCINKDPEAPIFSVSDFGLVADLFTAVPEMTSKV